MVFDHKETLLNLCIYAKGDILGTIMIVRSCLWLLLSIHFMANFNAIFGKKEREGSHKVHKLCEENIEEGENFYLFGPRSRWMRVQNFSLFRTKIKEESYIVNIIIIDVYNLLLSF